MRHSHIEGVTLITSHGQLGELACAVGGARRVAIDTETHDATVDTDGTWLALRVVAIATRDHEGTLRSFVVDVRDVAPALLAPLLSAVPEADAWNATFDEKVLALSGCPVRRWRDAMLTDALLCAGSVGFDWYHSLAQAARRHLGVTLTGKDTVRAGFDATSDLTEDQVAYAAQDAVVTLQLAERLDQLAEESGLTGVVELEQRARPFIARMTRVGLPLDTAGWSRRLVEHETLRDRALARLAELTAPADPTLFTDASEPLRPRFNPDSETQLRTAFNEYAAEAVATLTGGRLLGRTDPVDRTTLKSLIRQGEANPARPPLARGADLARAVLEYRTHAKMLSTYGDALVRQVGTDGRLHPRYKQALVATGRLASDRPNAQNLAPELKGFLRPPPGRVLVYGDLSQAELRVLAQLAGESRMVEVFRSGGDFHAQTAERMFNLDMAHLVDADPEAYAAARKKAKGVSFGLPYGLGAASLATTLTVEAGVETTPVEARQLLRAYAEAFPDVAAWLGGRDGFVDALAEQPPTVDWDATWRLYDTWTLISSAPAELRRKTRTGVGIDQLVEALAGDADEAARTALAERVSWALSFDAAVVLVDERTPFSFEGRTLSGRRRLYQVPMDSDGADRYAGVLTSAMLLAATTDKADAAAIRDAWAEANSVDLPSGVGRAPVGADRFAHRNAERARCLKAFEGANRPLKAVFVRHIIDEMGGRAGQWLLGAALADQIRSSRRRFRNQPIQGLVADIMLDAFGVLSEQVLPFFASAEPVLSVHDSVVIECDEADAAVLRDRLQVTLESAMSRWCPDVPPKADCDVRTSLDDSDVVSSVPTGRC